MRSKLVQPFKGLVPLRKIVPGFYYASIDGQLRHYSTDNTSVVDKFSPGLRSPFENPRRVRPSIDVLAVDAVKNDATVAFSKHEESGAAGRIEKDHIVQQSQTEKPPVERHEQNEQPLVVPPPVQSKNRFLERIGIPRIDDNLPDDEKSKLRVARNTKIGMTFMLLGSAAGLIWFCIHYGRSKRDESGAVMQDKYSGSLLAPAYRIADGFREWMNYAVEPAREKLLPDPLKAPFIQPKYTLVIEMKNVLVAPEWTYKTGYRFKKRPALEYFLDVVGYPNFELVIYTSEPPTSAYGVIDSIDSKQRIMYRLFRDCTKYTHGHHVKDLNKLNRDLSKVIFIDFDPESAKYNPENLLRLPKWDGDMDDSALVDLAELLKTIYVSDVDDVRPVLQFYSGFDNPTSEFRRRAIELSKSEQQAKEQQQNQSMLKKYTGFFGLRRHNV